MRPATNPISSQIGHASELAANLEPTTTRPTRTTRKAILARDGDLLAPDAIRSVTIAPSRTGSHRAPRGWYSHVAGIRKGKRGPSGLERAMSGSERMPFGITRTVRRALFACARLAFDRRVARRQS